MFMRKRSIVVVAAVAFVLIGAVSTADDAAPSFAATADPSDIALVSLAVLPDGTNLPEGSGTAAEGEPLYQLHCASCHGVEGEGGLANRLVGGHGSLYSDAPVKTLGSYWPYATTVFDYVRRSMPYLEPMSLTNDDYYALTAWMLNRNDIIGDKERMDSESLPQVVMPNRDGFINAYPEIPADYDYR
ncbi:MAG: c-type cytochrome [Pseudomonadota bacterium]